MKHLLCLGDSITDSGRIFENPPLGCGYVQLLKDSFREQGMDFPIRNCGVNGFTVSRLLNNAERGFYPTAGSIITILIGINDIGLIMNTDRTEEQKQHMMKEFFLRYEELLRLLSQDAEGILLMEPFLFPHPEEYVLWLPHLHTMSAGIARLAEKYGLPFLRLHDLLNSAAADRGYAAITTDGIHLTGEGHRILAKELFTVLRNLYVK